MSELDAGSRKFIEKYQVDIERDWLQKFHEAKVSLEAPADHEYTANQILVFNGGEAMGRYIQTENKVKKINCSGKGVFKVTPRGLEQYAALDLMLDPNVQLVFSSGVAGSGKSLLACASALEMVVGKPTGKYEQIILLRPVSYVGRSFGLVPGDADEKYLNFVGPVLALINELAPQKLEWMISEGKIVAQPIEYIRGTTFKNSIVILDEAQNTSVHEMKTIITRMDSSSKLFVCGDTKQVDERGDAKYKNGLTVAMDRMQSGRDSIVGSVEFFKSERGGISALATQRMDDK
jgi:PhoH-like ATPase